MNKQRMHFFLVISSLSIIISSIFTFAFDHPIVGDAIEYDRIAWNLVQNGSYSSDEFAPYAPTMYREPAYPIFLYFVYIIFGHSVIAVKLLQILLYAISTILIYHLVLNVINEKSAMLASFIFAIFPTSANYTSYLLSESFFTFLLITAMLLLVKAIDNKSNYLFFCAGTMLGISILCKASYILFFIPILFVLFIRYKSNLLKYYIIFVFSGILIILPWIVRNHLVFDTFSLTLRGGTQLLYRAIKLDDNIEKIKATVLYSISERLGNSIYPKFADNPAEFLDSDLNKLLIQDAKFREIGYTDVEIDKMNMKNAVSRISENPFKYLIQSIVEFIKLTAFTHIPLLNESHIIEKFNTFENGPLILSGIRGVFRLMAYTFLVLTALGMWIIRKKWKDWILFAFLIIYVNLIHSLLLGCGRYTVPLIPFYLIFSSIIFVEICERYDIKLKLIT